MKQKQLLYILITLTLMLFTGCFNVERNNPYDPDSTDFNKDLVETEVELTIKVTRGFSQLGLTGATIDITHNGNMIGSYGTNSEGELVLNLEPGTYEVGVSKTGWETKYKTINVGNSKTNESQEEVIELFIWRDTFDWATIGSHPQDHWTYSELCSGSTSVASVLGIQNQNNNDMGFSLQLYDPYPTGSEAGMWLEFGIPNLANRATINYAVAAVTFTEFDQNAMIEIDFLNEMGAASFSVVTKDTGSGTCFYYQTYNGEYYIDSVDPGDRNVKLLIQLLIDPMARNYGYLTIYNAKDEEYIADNIYFQLSNDPGTWNQVYSIDFFVKNYNASQVDAKFFVWEVLFF